MEQLTDNVKEFITLIVRDSIENYHRMIHPTTEEKIIAAIDTHSKTCQTGEEFRILKAKMIGLMVGIGVGSAGIGGAVATIITEWLKPGSVGQIIMDYLKNLA